MPTVKTIAQLQADIIAHIYENPSEQITATNVQNDLVNLTASYYNRLDNIVLADMNGMSDSTGMSLIQLGNSTYPSQKFFLWTNDGGADTDATIYIDSTQFFIGLQTTGNLPSLSGSAGGTSLSDSHGQYTTSSIGISFRSLQGIQIASAEMYEYHPTEIVFDSPIYKFYTATASRASAFDATSNLVASITTLIELSYVSGVTSSIQNQLNNINAGLSWKDAVRVQSGTNVTISSPGANVDSIAMNNGDRVSLIAQSTASQNGLYIWNGSAVAMTRTIDANSGMTILQATYSIEEGTYADQIYMCSTNAPITIGTTSLTFVKTSATTYTGSNGILLTGNNFTVNNSYFAKDATIDSVGNITVSSINSVGITLGNTFVTGGAGTLTFVVTGNTNVTLPISGTLATLAGAEAFTNKTGNISMWTNNSGYLTTANSATGLLTGYISSAGTVSATDTILQGIQKLNGNISAIVTSQWITSGSDIYYSAGNVMIGNASGPLSKLHVVETSTSTPRGILADQYSTGTSGSRITMRKARGTYGSPVVITTGDALASWTASGYDGATFIESGKILISSIGTIGTGIIPSTMALQTMTSAGTLTTGILIDQSQNVLIAGYLTLNADPTTSLQAATKQYVDNALASLDSKPEVAYAATSALPANTYNNGSSGVGATLTGTSNGPLLIDGVTILLAQAGQRVLICAEATSANNGWYTITQVGVVAVSPYILTRATESDQATEIGAGYITGIVAPNGVTAGSNNGKVFISIANDPFVVGTTGLTFSQVGGTYSAGSGLTLTGTTFSIASSAITNAMLAGSIASSKLVGTDIATVGTITSGTWNGTAINNAYIASMTSAQLATIISDETGSGKLVFGTAPTLTAPLLSNTTPNWAVGSFEYDGKFFYNTPTTGASGISPTLMYSIVPSGGFSLSTASGVQSVFPTSGDVWIVNANTTYWVQGIYKITKTTNSIQVGIAFALGGGASLTSVYIAGTSGANAVAPLAFEMTGVGSVFTNTSSTGNVIVQFCGTIRTNAAGTITPQINFSGTAVAPTLAQNSIIMFTPIGTDTTNIMGNVG